MVIQNFSFFDKNGKNINLLYNADTDIWEGTLYFDPTSIYLFDNENIFILEKVVDEYYFPTLVASQSISFEWSLNEFANEFFIYDVVKDHALKNYFINRVESKEIGYYDIYEADFGPLSVKAPLQFNFAFNPSAEKIFTRTLNVYLNDSESETKVQIASLGMYGEGVDEDERYQVWCQNFGIKFTKEDANILKDYDIKEAYPDWKQVNQARKELLVNKDQVFPYAGTYKGISNYVNLLGYRDILRIKEYWQNINPNSAYFNNYLQVDISDYLDDGKIDEFNLVYRDRSLKEGTQFKKTEFLAIAYQFTVATDNFDDDGIPIVEETTQFSVNEIFHKLYQLKDKLKSEFIPINVQIKDIIGEFIYFQKITLSYWADDIKIGDYDMNEDYSISYSPLPINGELFVRSLDPLYRIDYPEGIEFPVVNFNPDSKNPYENEQKYAKSEIPGIIDYITTYYSALQSEKFPSLSARYSWEYGDDPEKPVGAPVILNVDIDKFTCRSISGVRWIDLAPQSISAPYYWTFENIDFRNLYEITWKITKSGSNFYTFEHSGKISELHTLPHFLPFSGEYDVTAKTNDFYGNVTERYLKITVSDQLTPQIIAFSRLEDKFDFSLGNLSNIRVKDFGNSPFYFPRINLLNNEDIPNEIDIYKNVLQWASYFENRYGTGQNIYDVDVYDVDTDQYLSYDLSQSHPYINYWGLGSDDKPFKLSDLSDMTIDSLFFQRFCSMAYHDDFSAGFYIEDPQIGQEITVSKYSAFTIPSFVDLDDLIEQLNDTIHPAMSLFIYSVLDLPTPIVHAKARYLSKELYHILESDEPGVDQYSFYLPKKIYSNRAINALQSLSVDFDPEMLFLVAPVSDMLSGAVKDPQYWEDTECWTFINDVQRGYLPTVFDQNAFSLDNIKVYEESFNVPENSSVFFIVNNLDGKNDFVWTLTNYITGEEIIKVKSVPFFVWKFKDIGAYSISVEVFDNKNNTYFNEMKNFIKVVNKIDYTDRTEFLLNLRKNNLIKESYPR